MTHFHRARVLLLVSALALAACADSPPPAGELSYGSVYAQVTNQVRANGDVGHLFGTDLGALSAPMPPCAGAGAASRVGACCYLPAMAAEDDSASEPDLGTLTLTDAGASLGSIDYGSPFAAELLDPETWSSGDALVLTSTETPSPFAAFSVAVPGVSLPDTTNPTAISRTTSLALAWTPDAHAETMTVLLGAYAGTVSHGNVACTVADDAGAVTIDASLLAPFTAGDQCWITLTRETDRYIDLGPGYITFASQGIDEAIVPVTD